MTVKMPEPMTAPIPRAVSDQGPSDFLRALSGSSDSRMSLSMDLQANSWLGSGVLLRGAAETFRQIGLLGDVPCRRQKSLSRSVHEEQGCGGGRSREEMRGANDVELRAGAQQKWSCRTGRCDNRPGVELCLALRLAAYHLSDLLFVGAAGGGALCLGGCFLSCCALHFLALQLVGQFLGICHSRKTSFLQNPAHCSGCVGMQPGMQALRVLW